MQIGVNKKTISEPMTPNAGNKPRAEHVGLIELLGATVQHDMVACKSGIDDLALPVCDGWKF